MAMSHTTTLEGMKITQSFSFDDYGKTKNTSYVTLQKKWRGTPSFFVPFTLKIATLNPGTPPTKWKTNVDYQSNRVKLDNYLALYCFTCHILHGFLFIAY